jgi:methylated-DNA-[protein]-cysteine S-methyltransferase
MQHHDKICFAPLYVELRWKDDLLETIQLCWSADEHKSVLQTQWGEQFLGCLEQYLSGADVVWPALPLNWERVSVFSGQVLHALRKVPHGRWLTYGELAARCGRPKAARAVGRVMALNPWPLLVPCHRVLGADGRMTGFGSGLDMKAYLLNLEGVVSDHERILDMSRNVKH